ncbi:PaaI family thioesterase [Lysobacter enzymogenes]|uniref:PaaI family thioesterase n=1 Tax=Lysobacter enzymogenes TaxID=69 RepID=UPI00384E889B
MRRDNALWAMLDGRAPLPGAARTLGWRFDAHNETDRSVSVSFAAWTALLDARGRVHPGLLAAMLEESMHTAVAAELAPGCVATGVESNMAYAGCAWPGRIFGYARIERWRGSVCAVFARLSDRMGRTLATATASYRIAAPPWRVCASPSPSRRGLRCRLRKRAATKPRRRVAAPSRRM